jgi:hypothetical protein
VTLSSIALRLTLPVVARGFRALPTPARFRAAVALSDAAVRGLPSNWRFSGAAMDTDRDVALGLLLQALDEVRIPYAAAVRLEGLDAVRSALARGRGALAVGVHGAGVPFLAHALADAGIDIMPFATAMPYRCRGTDRILPSIDAKSPAALLQVRGALRGGRLVGALIDVSAGDARRALTEPIATGEIHLRLPLLELAIACGAAVLSIASSVAGDGTIRIVLEEIRPDPPTAIAHARALLAAVTRHSPPDTRKPRRAVLGGASS